LVSEARRLDLWQRCFSTGQRRPYLHLHQLPEPLPCLRVIQGDQLPKGSFSETQDSTQHRRDLHGSRRPGIDVCPTVLRRGAVPTDASAALVAYLRLFGSPFLGIAVLNWMARNA